MTRKYKGTPKSILHVKNSKSKSYKHKNKEDSENIVYIIIKKNKRVIIE